MHGFDTYDYGARGYYPAIGRFTTIDPCAEKDYSISPYAYCENNPVNRIDPDGREPWNILLNEVVVTETAKQLADRAWNSLNFGHGKDEEGGGYNVNASYGITKKTIVKGDDTGGTAGVDWLDIGLNYAGKTNDGVGGFASGMERSGGTFRLSNSTGFSPKHYTSGWGGNGSVTTYNTAIWGSRIAKGAILVNVVLGAYSINKANIADGRTFGYNTQVATGQVAGGMAGSWAGAEAGAAAGAAIGVWFGGVGVVPGAIIGSVVCGVLGGWGGSELGGAAVKGSY